MFFNQCIQWEAIRAIIIAIWLGFTLQVIFKTAWMCCIYISQEEVTDPPLQLALVTQWHFFVLYVVMNHSLQPFGDVFMHFELGNYIGREPPFGVRMNPWFMHGALCKGLTVSILNVHILVGLKMIPFFLFFHFYFFYVSIKWQCLKRHILFQSPSQTENKNYFSM